MNLQQTYNSKGEKRLYKKDENGKEVIFYKSKKYRLIIRDFLEEDAEKWITAMTYGPLTKKEKEEAIKKFAEKARNRDEENPENPLLITSISGKILGGIKVKPVDELASQAEIAFLIKDDFIVKTQGNNIISALMEMHKEYNWFEQLYLVDWNTNERVDWEE